MATTQSVEDILRLTIHDVDAALGPIVRAAVACGLGIRFSQDKRGWFLAVAYQLGEPWGEWDGKAASPEEAAARALVAAVEL